MRVQGSFRNYFKRSLICYTILFILLLFLLYYVFMTINLRMTTVQVNAQDNQKLTNNIEIWQDELVSTVLSLSQNDTVQDAVSRTNPETVSKVNQIIYQRINDLQLPVMFTLTDQEGEIISTNLNRDNQSTFLSAMPNKALREYLEKRDLIYSERYSRINYLYEQNTVWLFAARIMREGKPIGYLYLDVTEAGLRDKLSQNRSDAVVLVDEFDNVIYSETQQTIGNIGKLSIHVEKDGFVAINARQYYVSVSTIADNGIRVLTFTSILLHQQMMRFGMMLIAVMALVLISLVPWLADYVTRRNLRPIETMIQTVRSHDPNSRIRERSFSEFQLLYDEFNLMMEHMQVLARDNEELVQRKRMMEVKHLKDQFNPHFVFNVMENLHFIILTNPEKAADMLVAFANLMRYEIDDAQTLVPLETDIEFVNDYLLLQKMRYGDKLRYNFGIPDSLLQCRIPKLLIQPIVENSIKHALSPNQGISIHVTARLEGDLVVLCIADDGVGIPSEQLAILNNILSAEETMTTHIGLYNTHRVLRLMYGATCGLTISSNKAGQGTIVELRVPMVITDV